MSYMPVVGDLGTVLYVRVVDSNSGSPVDVSAPASTAGTVTKPDGTTAAISFVPSTDGTKLPTNGWVQYQTASVAPSFFSAAGYWTIRVTVTTTAGAWSNAKLWRFKVYA